MTGPVGWLSAQILSPAVVGLCHLLTGVPVGQAASHSRAAPQRKKVVAAKHGLSFSIHLSSTAYPRGALVRVRLVAKNVSSRTIYVHEVCLYGFGEAQVQDESGRVVSPRPFRRVRYRRIRVHRLRLMR